MIWDLLNQSSNQATSLMNATVPTANGSQGQQGNVSTSSEGNSLGATSSWKCDYEVNSLSWSPQSFLTSRGNDWLGVTGGRGVWGLSM